MMYSGGATLEHARANALVKKPLPWSLPCLKFVVINFQVSEIILLQNILIVLILAQQIESPLPVCHFILPKIHLRYVTISLISALLAEWRTPLPLYLC
jgi:hypothetical protein